MRSHYVLMGDLSTGKMQKYQLDGLGTDGMPGLWNYERAAWRAGHKLVAGVDEAGRGPLAGPVVAAAVILPRDFDPQGINDSKTLSASEREMYFEHILASSHAVGVGLIEHEVIDKVNIYQATRLAMIAAVADLGVTPDLCLLDGLPWPSFDYPQTAIVKGDSKSVSIAAASIVAKVTRDRIMLELDKKYPGYGFAKHKGYATYDHLEAIARLGVCPEHRLTFKPCRQESEESCLLLDLTEV